jgi:CDP-4-dehydro-6-deoxyglucose reductase
MEPWRKGTVIRITQETPNTRRFWIQIPELERFDFKPGQFVTLDLPIHEQKNKRWRSYSIASWPDGTNVFELVIVLLEGGLGTTYLFNEIGEGSELIVRGPQGVFTLPEPLEKDLFLVCTGTGIAPFRSMVNYLRLHNLPHRNIHLIFGTRTFGDLLYYEEMRALSASMEGFFYHPALSREHREGHHHGYVHQVYESICVESKDAFFFLCGWKQMIDEAKTRITALGIDRRSIHQELYG